MRIAQRRLARLLALLLALAFVAAACGGSSDDDSNAGSSDTAASSDGGTDLESLEGTLNGSGSSFQNNFELAAIDAFTEDAAGVTINYNSVGSGQGKTDLANEVTDFAGSDSLVKEEDVASFQGGEFLYFPIVGAPVTVSYNLDVDELQLSPETLAKIMQGDITTWDDAAIKGDNPDADLPSTKITIVHRADGSGTTNGFTKYLDKAAKGTWELGSGDTVEWPASSQAGEKNTGVAQLIQQTDGAIGYVDFSDADASGLTFAKIKNKAGNYVEANLENASAAFAGATLNDDFTVDVLDADGDDSYPITLSTYVIVYAKQTDQAKGDALKAYLKYLVTDAQDLAEDEGFAKLPDELRSKVEAHVDDITVGA